MLYGVDVHDGYQQGLSFATLARQGYTFAAVKLTEGTGYVREQADEWVGMARAAGLIPGAYHWLNATDGAAQARWFHERVKLCGGPEGMLIQLDCEDDGYGAAMTAWAGEWKRLSGGHPFLIYSGSWWWPRTGGFNGARLTPYLWHSHYLTADTDTLPDDPAEFAARIPWSWWAPGYGGWTGATFLQFTSRGDAGGLANNVDLNCTRLTREQLLALTTGDPFMALSDRDAQALIWRTDALVKNLPAVAGGPTKGEPNALHAELARIRALLEAPGGVDTAAVLAGVEQQLTALRADVGAETRDAVADLGEGGAAQVRAGEPPA